MCRLVTTSIDYLTTSHQPISEVSLEKLIYSLFTSLAGYVADATGSFDWAEPDEEAHSFVNDQERPIDTYIYGRKLYEMMAVWETPEVFPSPTPAVQEYARIWQEAEKIVYSRTLSAVTTARTRIEKVFDPAKLRDLKARSERDLCIGGPTLAAEAIRAGLVNEFGVCISPIIVGGGNPFLRRRLPHVRRQTLPPQQSSGRAPHSPFVDFFAFGSLLCRTFPGAWSRFARNKTPGTRCNIFVAL